MAFGMGSSNANVAQAPGGFSFGKLLAAGGGLGGLGIGIGGGLFLGGLRKVFGGNELKSKLRLQSLEEELSNERFDDLIAQSRASAPTADQFTALAASRGLDAESASMLGARQFEAAAQAGGAQGALQLGQQRRDTRALRLQTLLGVAGLEQNRQDNQLSFLNSLLGGASIIGGELLGRRA